MMGVRPRSHPCARRLSAGGLLLLCLALTCLAPRPGGAQPTYRVLLVNSYHPGYGWSDEIQTGLREALFESFGAGLELQVEYLDGKRHSAALAGELGERILAVWAAKFAGTRFDLLLASDQDAHDLLWRARPRLFPGIPLLHSSVERPAPSDSITTGIRISEDLGATVELIARLRPGCRIWVVTDATTTGRINQARLQTLAPGLSGASLHFFDEAGALEVRDLLDRVAVLPAEDAVFFLDYAAAPSGAVDLPEVLRELAAIAPVPIFSHREQHLAWGATGGMMSRGHALGRQLAGLATRVLKGESPARLGEVVESSEAVFDWRRLIQHGIAPDRLPAGSRLLHRPVGTWRANRHIILPALAFILVEGLLIVWLILLLRRQRSLRRLAAQASERFRRLFDLAPIPMSHSAGSGRILGLNRRFTNVTGYSLEDLPTVEEWFRRAYPDPDYRREVMRSWTASLQDGSALHPQLYQVACKDGQTRPMEVAATQDGDGLLVCLIDVSERARAEVERERLRRQLVQSQRLESVGRLAGGVAHDFNNMLCVILGHCELALAGLEAGQPLHGDLLEIQKAATRSTNLTRQLLAFARRQTVMPQVLDLNEVVAGMLDMLRRLLGEHLTLDWRPGPALWPVRMDPSQVDQILVNLCVNARDAIQGTGQVTVATDNATLEAEACASMADSLPGNYVRLVVKDTGCGMDRETLSHIFEPFFTTRELGKGTGLGLATVYGAVRQNHGFIDVASSLGQGTRFTIHLPRHAGSELTGEQDAAAPAPARGRESILLVEDEAAILDMVALMLEHLGYTVLAASSPLEAIEVARQREDGIDLLLTDVIMPEMNGRDLARRLQEGRPGLQCLFMSGYTADVIAHHGVLDPDLHFIQKPFSLADLSTGVRVALGAQQ
ncbi:MAG: ATP-binding protein [bacterium]|jgi:PAS domain S-box-containing protein|nr:ATP-binding protein [bacterium]